MAKPHRPLATAHRLIYDGDAEGFRNYLHQLYTTGRSGQAEAGELLYECTCKQGADYVKQVLETSPADETAVSLVRFLTEEFFPRFSTDADSRHTLQRVYLLYKNLAVAAFEALRTPDSAQWAYTACDRYAQMQDTATAVGRLGICSARTKAVEILEATAELAPRRDVEQKLAQAYGLLAEYHCMEGGQEHIRKAMQYREKELRLYAKMDDEASDEETRRGLATALEQTADLLCRDYSKGSMKLAEPRYERAVALRKAQGDALPLARCYGKLGRLQLHCSGAGRQAQAIALYRAQEALLSAAYATDATVELAGELADCRMTLGDLYAIGGASADCMTALRYYKDAAALRLKRMQALHTRDSGMVYAQARDAMARTLWRIGGEDQLNAALSGTELVFGFVRKQQEETGVDYSDFLNRCQLLLYALEEKLWLKHPMERLLPEFNPAYTQAFCAGEALEALELQPDVFERVAPIYRIELRRVALPAYRKHLRPGMSPEQQGLHPQTKSLLKFVTEE